MDGKISKLISEDQIRQRVRELSGEITEELGDKDPLFIAVLKGSFMFFSDLLKNLDFPLETDFIKASSYKNGTVSSGTVELSEGPDVAGRNVVIVEDIVDTGRTLKEVRDYFQKKGAQSVTTVTLLDKPDRREVEIAPDYTGFVIEDNYVLGYGLDIAEKGRNLPYIGIFDNE